MEEQPRKFYLSVSNLGEPLYDDIVNSDLPKEEKVKQIKWRGQAYRDELDNQLHKDYARIGLGGLVSAVGALPIAITKNPVIGSAIGGGVYELGQGIMEGDELPELMQRAGWGGAIGGTVGGAVSKLPDAARFVNNLSGGKIGNALKPIGDKITNSKLYDVLMTDIRAFNPNKQTVYHGSPYDFNKFSNEAIGTGEGAQAHGLGHYAAKNKDIAKRYAETLSGEKPIGVRYKGENYEVGFNPKIADWEIKGNVESLTPEERHLFELIDSNRSLEDIKGKEQKNIDRLIRMKGRRNRFRDAQKSKDIINLIDNNDVEILPENKQLYKLSVPKDDVMLREDLLFSEQPKKVQDALKEIYREDIENWKTNITKELESNIGAKNILLDSLEKAKAKGSDRLIYTIENDIKANMPTYENNIELLSSRLANEKIPVELNRTGKEIYNDIRSKFLNKKYPFGTKENRMFRADDEFEKEASDLLNKYGIKGISYNGGIDGEARVIFNPDDIVIGRKYYNQPNLYQQLTGKQNTGALVDALLNR